MFQLVPYPRGAGEELIDGGIMEVDSVAPHHCYIIEAKLTCCPFSQPGILSNVYFSLLHQSHIMQKAHQKMRFEQIFREYDFKQQKAVLIPGDSL